MVKIDKEIIDNSINGIETIVKQGERIGEKIQDWMCLRSQYKKIT